MRNRNRILARFLAVCLLALGLPTPPASAADHWVAFTQDAEGGVNLALNGLDPDKLIYGVQLEVMLDGTYQAEQLRLTPPDSAAYSPEGATLISHRDGRTVARLYLTSAYTLNRGSQLDLGKLTADGFGIIPGRVRIGLFDSEDLANGPATGEKPVVMEELNLRPEGDISSSVVLGSGHSIRVEQSSHGTVRANPTAWRGQTVALEAVPEDGYYAASVKAVTSTGTIWGTDMGNGRWVFTMPDGDVTIQAEFSRQTESQLPFQDVKEGDWFYDAVRFVYENKMMSGTGGNKFSPGTTTDRGMIVTILHRLEGNPQAGQSSFPDVERGQWYAAAVDWAAEKGVVNGYDNGRFGPADRITREQMAAILYRYAQLKGYDTASAGSLTGFTDGDKVSSYAAESLRWAVGAGVITGKDGNRLDPKGGASRAEAATILMRFSEKVRM